MANQRVYPELPNNEFLVYDEREPCPYLPNEIARMPLRYFAGPGPLDLDKALDKGDRRAGQLLYRPTCPTCNACQAIRIPVDEFRPSRSQSRCWAKNQDLEVSVGSATFSEDRLHLYNRHKIERGLGTAVMDREHYEGWFLRTNTVTLELSLRYNQRLIGLTILDVGKTSTSAVYGFFDPDLHHRSLGVFMVLASLAWAKQHGMKYHYLGLYIAQNAHVSYKANYLPHERRIENQWHRFDKSVG